MAQETSKQRWNRIELDYYKVRGAAAWWRSIAAIMILIGSAVWLILAPSWDPAGASSLQLFQTRRLASPGPLARPHAIWESRCEACHAPFSPINGSRWAPIAEHSPRAGDTHCQSCHTGLSHHAGLAKAEAESVACAECHRDHRGRDESLTRIGDNACVGCHADLKGRPGKVAGERLSTENSVTRFDRVHPEFSPLRPDLVGTPKRDPGRLKFNHRVHLTPGMNLEPGGRPLLKYAALNERDRRRYGGEAGADAEKGVALDCGACHRLADGSRSPRSGGGDMLPVTFENDCRGCHPLAFDPRLPGVEARHGIPPGQLVGELRQRYEAQAVRDDPELLRRPVGGTEIPGNRFQARRLTAAQAVEAKVTAAIRMLLPNGKGGCTECHTLKPPAVPAIASRDAESLAIEPVRIPEVWLPHAQFDHSAHRALRCDSCHRQGAASESSGDILLPGIRTCLECHAPSRAHSAGATGGAGFGCTECHRYHGGAPRSQEDRSARATRILPPESLKTIREFLDGAGEFTRR